ncbi:hypothetical protein GCM10023115_10930 [Pontixanthobacter gangjinensis]|uniref:Glycosyl transferase family protein n=1 Tax=Pontixanthobacter gangjinensis TaxID=1028742 RepID=A0A6I4SKP9_9SPHN|nr:glycosyl transferase family protein [Pontixanthobacter gangjinensis]MXO56339.1 glycosyl transferase family protein [Pontixanthobacter gangjinensis]
MTDFTAWQWFVLVQHELLLFAGVFFLIGALDELGIDCAYLWFRLAGRIRTETLGIEADHHELTGLAAVFIPTWQESAVIGATISHALNVWPHSALRMYIGCYRNDPATMSAVLEATSGDPRLRLVVHDCDGPSTKADCLNRLYQALQTDERRLMQSAHMIVLHDAEDMVDAAALTLLDRTIRGAELAQIPVLPMPQPHSVWIAGHYCEEFAEAHGKAMMVRDAIGAGMPLAGVGCAISRPILTKLASTTADRGPFAADCLTEDYELGLGVADMGGRAKFVRQRYQDGRLVATRACFPARLDQAVRQKTRWVHGIAFQGWDRLGWSGRPAEFWMRLRDRRGPFTAIVLAAAYVLLILSAAGWALSSAGFGEPLDVSPILQIVLALNFVSFAWRVTWRFAFTAREYGVGEGLRAILRVPIANIIAIMAGRRALVAYWLSLKGHALKWDKTDHFEHPVMMPLRDNTI